MELLMQVILLIIGFVMLMKGADWFVEGAAGIADRFGIPQLVIGLTIVAMGTSTPEAAVSISAALQENAGITIGNVVGSNILNILLILGLTAAITAVAVQKSTIMAEIPFLIGISVLLPVLGMVGGTIGRMDGVIFWVLFILYLLYLFRMAKKGQKTSDGEGDRSEKGRKTSDGEGDRSEAGRNSPAGEEDMPQMDEKMSIWKIPLMILVGGVMIIWGADITVDSATVIAQIFGMSDRLIGLTIVAFGTSLPELITSVTAARKGKADIAVGNIVGSNIFNILFVVGTAALITPVPFASSFIVDNLVGAAAAVLLLICVARKKRLERPAGILMLIAYGVYFVYLLT